ncbi:MAG: efflux transporter outer membrane subunit [Puniceicoccaceae bacterium]
MPFRSSQRVRPAAAGTLLLLLLVAGCSIPRPDPRTEVSALAPADGWTAGGEAGGVSDDWIASFDDPVLDGLVAEAQEANPDLARAAASLSAAVAQARQANSALFPRVDLGAGAGQTRFFELTEEQERLGVSRNQTDLGVSLDLSWELDVWDRVSDSAEGAALAARATAADYAFARQSLAAQVAKGWFQALTAKRQLELANQFVENFKESHRLAEARYRAGDVSAQDSFTALADLAGARSNAEDALFAARAAIRSLEVLLGRYPADELAVAGPLERTLPPVPAGLPSSVLERRPDLIAAERRVSSAFRLAGAASAARLPRFSLGAAYQTSGENFGDLFDAPGMLANLGVNLFQPLFDAGLLRSRFEEAEAGQAAAVAAYRSTALTAFAEVEDTLALEKSLLAQVDNLALAAESFEKARRIGEMRYREGETDLTSYLVVQRQALQAQADLIAARGRLLTNRVDLHLALGGNFESGPVNDTPAPPPLPSQESPSSKQP